MGNRRTDIQSKDFKQKDKHYIDSDNLDKFSVKMSIVYRRVHLYVRIDGID